MRARTVTRTVFRINRPVDLTCRTIRDAAVNPFRCSDYDQLRTDPTNFVAAATFAHRCKTRRGALPCEHIGRIRTSEPGRCIPSPMRKVTGLNT